MSGLIDFHSHFAPDWYVELAKAAGYERIDGMPAWPQWSPEAHLALMDEQGIECSVLSLSSPGVHFGERGGGDEAAIALARRTNDFGAELVRAHPGRFELLASLPIPAVDAAIAEAGRALGELGAVGVAVKTNAHGVYLGDPRMDPLWAELDARGAIAVIHPTAAPGADATAFGRPSPMLEYLFDTTRAIVDLAVSGAFERFPGIEWLVPHAGAVLPAVVDRVSLFQQVFGPALQGGRERIGERVLAGTLPGLWYDLAGTPMPRQARALADVAATERIVYGSDWCFTPGPLVAQQIAGLDAHWSAAVGGDWRELTTANARELLKRGRR